MMHYRFVPTLILAAVISGCGGGSSNGGSGGEGLSAQTSPATGSTILANDTIILSFSAGMDTASLTLSGSLHGKSDGGVWSDGTQANDTLTISPSPEWFVDPDQSLNVSAADSSGRPIAVRLNYAINSTKDSDADGSPDNLDCDNASAQIFPGNTELCDAQDNDCDGYSDEGCGGCDPSDPDGDGVSECDGDCAPADPDIYPGNTEICDNKDNDCNTFTRENCAVGEACNLDGDGNQDNDADICAADALCTAEVDQAGSATGNYFCTAYCNSSETGAVGEYCATGESCYFDLLRDANLRTCAATTATLGVKQAGATCAANAECRSGSCGKLTAGPGGAQNYCLDTCGSDSYCTMAGTLCRVRRNIDSFSSLCWNTTNVPLGGTPTGSSCSLDSECDHGICAQIGSAGVCTEACVRDEDCGIGFTCTLGGEQISTSFALSDQNPGACTVDADCETGLTCLPGTNTCGFIASETIGMCVADVASQGALLAGFACAQNSDCRSNFCDATQNVCIDVCGANTDCPDGLSCRLQIVETTTDGMGKRQATQARVCVGAPSNDVIRRMP